MKAYCPGQPRMGREISLLSLSTSDYPHLDELLARLTAEFTPRHVSISLPSLRVDSQLKHLPQLTSEVATLSSRVDEHLRKMGAVWK